MPVEEFSLKLERYRDKNNLPTCALNFITQQVCHFYGTKTFGTKEVCLYLDIQLFRRHQGYGSLIPSILCPLWKDQILK